MIAIIREDLIRDDVLPGTPTMLKYKTHAEQSSLYNTPPAYGIYICGKVFQMVENTGRTCCDERNNEKKAKCCMISLIRVRCFKGTVVPKDRSLMNVPFVIGDKIWMLNSSKKRRSRIENLKGHRYSRRNAC